MDFQQLQTQHPDLPFSEQLRLFAQAEWDQVVQHRFTEQLGDNTLPDSVFARYLVQDYAFVEVLVTHAARALANAPDMPRKKVLAQFLAAVMGDENSFFLRSFEALNVSSADYSAPILNPVSTEFAALLNRASLTGYAEAMVTLLVAEWSYRSWAQRQAAKPQPTKFWLQEWIWLHDNPEFNSFVDWLIEEINSFSALPNQQQVELAQLFKAMCELEHRFFSICYEEPTHDASAERAV